MGIDFTFEDTAVIFSIIGAGFGASTATMTIENIVWSETSLFKRVLRGLIGAAVIIVIFLLLGLIPHEDHPTKYFFNNLLPHLIAAYCAFGLVPIFSKYIGLVNKNPDVNSSVASSSYRPTEYIQHVDSRDSVDSDEKGDVVDSLCLSGLVAEE